MCVCAVFAMLRVRVCRCVHVCAFFACWNITFISVFNSFFVWSALLLLLPYHVCVTPCLKLSSSLLSGSHGTTADEQQVSIDHYYACVNVAYNLCILRVRCVCNATHVCIVACTAVTTGPLQCSKSIISYASRSSC